MTLELKCSAKELKEVMAGEKTIITREIRPANAKKYVRLNEKEECVGIIGYDRIYLHNDNIEASITAEIEKTMLMEIVDENGDLVHYDYHGESYQMVEIDYHLGAILDISGPVPYV